MKKLLTILLILVSFSAFGNPIDDKCKQFVYKSAPIVSADQYICHTQYALAYSFNSRNPIYTVEFLDKSHVGNLPRTNNFRVDPAIAPSHQATPEDYIGAMCNGDSCDRGHMNPSEDFSACFVCDSESFFMSNMVPQNIHNNRGIWKSMEYKMRKYASNHQGGVYIITGPVYMFTSHVTIGKNKVWVPDYLFKIMIDAVTGKSIAFFIPNKAQLDPATGKSVTLHEQDKSKDNDPDNLSKYVVNLETIETVTGIKFDASMDKITVANYQVWLAQTKVTKK